MAFDLLRNTPTYSVISIDPTGVLIFPVKHLYSNLRIIEKMIFYAVVLNLRKRFIKKYDNTIYTSTVKGIKIYSPFSPPETQTEMVKLSKRKIVNGVYALHLIFIFLVIETMIAGHHVVQFYNNIKVVKILIL